MDLFEFPQSQEDRASADVADTTGPYDGLSVDLFQVNIDINKNTPIAAFTDAVADYSGYAAGAITWETVSIADDGIVEVLGTVPVFKPTGTTVSNTIYGLYILNVGGTAVYFAGLFDEPIGMGELTDRILLTIRYRPATNTVVVVVS